MEEDNNYMLFYTLNPEYPRESIGFITIKVPVPLITDSTNFYTTKS